MKSNYYWKENDALLNQNTVILIIQIQFSIQITHSSFHEYETLYSFEGFIKIYYFCSI